MTLPEGRFRVTRGPRDYPDQVYDTIFGWLCDGVADLVERVALDSASEEEASRSEAYAAMAALSEVFADRKRQREADCRLRIEDLERQFLAEAGLDPADSATPAARTSDRVSGWRFFDTTTGRIGESWSLTTSATSASYITVDPNGFYRLEPDTPTEAERARRRAEEKERYTISRRARQIALLKERDHEREYARQDKEELKAKQAEIRAARIEDGSWRDCVSWGPWLYRMGLRPTDLRDAVENSRAKPAKAVGRAIHTATKINMPAEWLAQVGTLFATTPNGAYDILITLGNDGDRADYLNPRSCWWSEYGDSRIWHAFNGGGAVRAYNDYGDLIGRVWFLPYSGSILTNGAILFNAYGRDELAHIDTWGSVVATALGLESAPVNFYRNVSQAAMYVNSRTAVFVGDVARQPERGTRFAVRAELRSPQTGRVWNAIDELLATARYCARCDDRLRLREDNSAEAVVTIDNRVICTRCAEDATQVTEGDFAGRWARTEDTIQDGDRVTFTGGTGSDD